MAFLLTSCTKKDLDFEVVQVGCDQFAIASPSIQILSDPSCTGSPLYAEYEVTFAYTGNAECLYRIVIEHSTRVQDAQGERIDSASYPMEFLKSSEDVSIDYASQKVTFRFRVDFPNVAAADSFNDLYIVFHCENSEGVNTKQAKLHLNGTCSVPPAGIGPPIKTITVPGNTIHVRLWDNSEQDGDIVSVYLNGVWVLQQYMLTNAGGTFDWAINTDVPNDLILVANNQGSTGPNTCSISINGIYGTSIDLDLETGATIRIL